MNLFRANLQYLDGFCTKPIPLSILVSKVHLMFFRGVYQSTAIYFSNKVDVYMRLHEADKHCWENDL